MMANRSKPTRKHSPYAGFQRPSDGKDIKQRGVTGPPLVMTYLGEHLKEPMLSVIKLKNNGGNHGQSNAQNFRHALAPSMVLP